MRKSIYNGWIIDCWFEIVDILWNNVINNKKKLVKLLL